MEIIQNREAFYRATNWNDIQAEYLESLLNSDDERDHIVCARMGYGLERLVHSESADVRRAVALAGYGLDILAKDESACVRDAVVANAAIVRLTPDVLNTLLADPDIVVQLELISHGFGLDQFSKSDNELVRAEVAETGYSPETFRYDPSASVRASVAKALPKIEEHRPHLARDIAQQFLTDPNWYVRKCLAESGYSPDILAHDPVPSVRDSSLAAKIKSAEDRAVPQDPDWCYSPCDHRSHGR